MRATERTDALRRVAEALNATIDPEAAMAALLPELEHVLGLKTAWAFRFEPRRRTFTRVGATGLPPALAADNQAELRWPGCECQNLYLQGKLRRAVNMVRCSRLAGAEGDTGGLVFHASVPLRSKGEILGIMNVAAPGRSSFDGEALSLLLAVGNQVAVALDRSALYAEEQRRSRQLGALADVARELASITDPATLLGTACRLGCERFGVDRMALLDSAGNLLAGWSDTGETRPSARGDGSQPIFPGSKCSEAFPAGKRMTLVAEFLEEDALGETDKALLSAYAAHVGTGHENAMRQVSSRQAAVLAERQRIAADLHDAVSQRLFSALFAARAAALTLPSDPEKSQRALRQAQAEIQTAQGEMTQLVRTLRPPAVTHLATALDALLRPIRLSGETRLVSRIDRVPVPLPPEAQTTVFRIAEEALHNALKHGKGREVKLSLSVGKRRLCLRVSDDGRGFEAASVQMGNGLRGMEERARGLGGWVRIETQRGRGTRITLMVPMKEGSDRA